MAESSETKRNWEFEAPQDRIKESPAFQAGVTQKKFAWTLADSPLPRRMPWDV